MRVAHGSYDVSEFATHLDSEIRRLDAQVDLFWRSEKRLLVQYGLCPGMSVLDCGCGPGRVLELLHEEFSDLTLTGLEIDPILVDACRQRFLRRNVNDVRIEQGSAEEPGLDANSFDFIVMRLVLEHIPEPGNALKGLRKLLKPGGRIVIISNDFDFHLRTWPPVAELDPLYEAYCASRRQDGGDPCLGRRLPILLKESGFFVEGFEVEVAHSQLVGDKAFFQAEGVGIPSQLVKTGFLDQQVFEDMIHNWKEMLKHPEHSMMRQLYIGVGRRQNESEEQEPTSPSLDRGGVPIVPTTTGPVRVDDPDYVGPSDELERQLVHLWENAMNLTGVGVRSNFFDLGGDSLSLEQIQSDMQTQFAVALPMAVLFQHPTIEQMARYLKQRAGATGGQSGAAALETPTDGSDVPASTISTSITPSSEASRDTLAEKARRRREALSNQKGRHNVREQNN